MQFTYSFNVNLHRIHDSVGVEGAVLRENLNLIRPEEVLDRWVSDVRQVGFLISSESTLGIYDIVVRTGNDCFRQVLDSVYEELFLLLQDNA